MTKTDTPHRHNLIPALLVETAKLLAALAVLAGAIWVSSAHLGVTANIVSTAIAVAVVTVLALLARRSEPAALVMSISEELDERRRLLRLKANTFAGRAAILTGALLYILVAIPDEAEWARAGLSAADGVHFGFAITLFVYLVGQFGAAIYYSKRN